MKVTKELTKYYLYRLDYEFNLKTLEYCRHLKSFFGWETFTFSDKAWRFNNIAVLADIKSKYPDIVIEKDVSDDYERYLLDSRGEELTVRKSEEIKKATESTLEVKGIKGTPYEYQKLTVEFAINSNGRALLALDLGTGKTFCSLAYVAHTKKAKTLVVCPSSMKYTWKNETEKWTKLKGFVVESKGKLSLEEYQANDVLIINYEILKKNFELLSSVMIDCLIIDESQYCKNNTAMRTKLVKALSRKIPSALLLSGTPILNRPIELFSQLNIIDPITWNNYYSYAKKYCGAWQSPWGLDVSGASNLEELRQRINKYVIRIKKEDVLKDLPEKNFVNIPIRIDKESQKNYNLVENSFIEYLKEVKDKTDKEINKTLQAEKLAKLNELRQISTIGKQSVATEIIENIVESGQKVVVFCSYNAPLLELQKKLKEKAVMIIGSTSAQDRMVAIDAFQKDDKIKVFLGGMLSANTGITLTAAQNVLFLNYDWTPANMSQCTARIDRIGQEAKNINIYQIIAMDTIDQKIEELLKGKKEIIGELIDGEVVGGKKENSVINNLINLYGQNK